MTRSSEYSTWQHMIRRCKGKVREIDAKNYRDRGINICARWLGEDGFVNFFEDMGPRPSPGHSIDRIDNNRGYSPDNCRWATGAEQNRNKRNNHVVEFRGEHVTLGELAERYGILCQTLHGRVLTLKWDIERAVTVPVKKYTRLKGRPRK